LQNKNYISSFAIHNANKQHPKNKTDLNLPGEIRKESNVLNTYWDMQLGAF